MSAPDSHSNAGTPEQRLHEIIDGYLDRLLEGNAPPLQEILQAHPDLSEVLEKRLLGLKLAHRMTQQATRGQHHAPSEPEAGSSAGAALAAETDLSHGRPIPRKVGRYKIRGVLGSGASAIVYHAFDPLLRRQVALKVVEGIHGTSPAARERFQRDARIAARLWHPHIVPIHESGQYRGRLYIDMELVRGQSLETRLLHGPLDFREAAELLRKLAVALDYAHELGVVHRDVKPSNILLDAAGEPKLTDFGLARLLAGETTITHDGQILGTPAYMSPEQAQGGGHQADRRSDVYGLGAVLYRVLTGQTPFQASDTAATLYQVVHTQPPAPRQCHAAVPRDLETICLKAMAKAPEERFRSAAALAEELRRWLHDEPLTIRRPTTWERWRSWARRNRLAARIAGAAVVLVALVGGILGRVAWSQYQSAYEAEVLRQQEAIARRQVEADALEVEIQSRLEQARQRLRLAQEGRRRDTQEILRGALRLLHKLPAGASADRLALEARSLFAASLGVPEFQVVDRLTLPGDGFTIWPVALHPDGQSLAFGTAERPWCWTCGQAPPPTSGLNPPVSGPRLRYSPDGKSLVFAPATGGLESWDERASRCLVSLEPRGSKTSEAMVAIGFDGAQALWACRPDGRISCWSAAGKLLSHCSLGLAKGMTVAVGAFNGDATRLAFALASLEGRPKILLWDGKDPARELTQAATPVSALAWSPDSRSVAVGTQDGNVQLWSTGDGLQEHRLVMPCDEISGIHFDPNNRWLLAGGGYAGTRLWDVGTGEQLLTSPYHPRGFSRDGRRFAGTRLDAIALVQIEPPENARPLTGHNSGTQQISWSRDSRHFVSVDRSFRVCIWDALHATRLDCFQALPGPFYGSNTAAALSDDGQQVAYASGNRVLLREVATGRSLGDWPLPRGFDRMVFADGRFLLVREQEVEEGNEVWQSVVYELRSEQELPKPRVIRPGQPGERRFLAHDLSANGRFFCWSGPRRPPQARRIEVREVATGRLIRNLSRSCEELVPECTGGLSADGRFLWARDPFARDGDPSTIFQYDVTGNALPLPLARSPVLSHQSSWAVSELRPDNSRTLYPWPGDRGYWPGSNQGNKMGSVAQLQRPGLHRARV